MNVRHTTSSCRLLIPSFKFSYLARSTAVSREQTHLQADLCEPSIEPGVTGHRRAYSPKYPQWSHHLPQRCTIAAGFTAAPSAKQNFDSPVTTGGDSGGGGGIWCRALQRPFPDGLDRVIRTLSLQRG